MGVIVSYVEAKRGVEDAFGEAIQLVGRKSGSPILAGTTASFGWVAGLLLAGNESQRLVAAAAVRSHCLGDHVVDPAGGGGMPEGGDLGRFDAPGKPGGLTREAVWT